LKSKLDILNQFGLWFMVYGLLFGVWRLGFGVWCLVFGVWCLVFGVCGLVLSSTVENPNLLNVLDSLNL